VVIAGGFGEGHIPCEGLKELARLAKPKGNSKNNNYLFIVLFYRFFLNICFHLGLVVIVMRKEYLSYVKDYVNRLEPLMNELQDSGLIFS
jgi:hypothetical protein